MKPGNDLAVVGFVCLLACRSTPERRDDAPDRVQRPGHVRLGHVRCPSVPVAVSLKEDPVAPCRRPDR
jgi:hypothetical protein